MNQECIYCGRTLSGESLSKGKDGWVCADIEGCLASQETISVSESTHVFDDLQKSMAIQPVDQPKQPGETQSQKLERLCKEHRERVKQLGSSPEKLNERASKMIEAQITWTPWECLRRQCRIGYNTVKPYPLTVPVPPPTAQDTFWGDLKTKINFDPSKENEFYQKQSNFEINLEPDNWGLFGSAIGLMYSETFSLVRLLDNVVIEEYEVEYKVSTGLFSSEKVTIPYHRIVRVERGGQLIYPEDADAEITEAPGAIPTPTPPLEGAAAFGTGFFVSNEGHLLTCHHVINNARGIEIITFDGKKCTGEVIQADPANDLALLKVDTVSRGITLSDSSGLAMGEEVLTLGYN